MPHADSALVSSSITSKPDFYESVNESLDALLDPGSGSKLNWISALSNAASLLYSSYAGWPHHNMSQVNWVGFYLLPSYFPSSIQEKQELLLGPFHGRPACQSLALVPARAGGTTGVCAKAFNSQQTALVSDVHAEPGHIACDALTNSEIVLPLYDDQHKVVGVLDLDSEQTGGFTDQDAEGLQEFVKVLQRRVQWI